MRLRIKTLMIVGIAMAGLFAVLFVGMRATISRSYAQQERMAAAKDAERVSQALGGELRQLERTCADWAERPGCVLGQPGRAEISASHLTDLGVNLMLFVDASGELIRAEQVDLDLGIADQVDQAAVRAILAEDVLLDPADPLARVSGVVRAPGSVILVASRSIAAEGFHVAPAGTVISARYIDRALLERLGEITRLPVEAFLVDSEDNPEDVKQAIRELQGAATWSRTQDARTIAAYTLLRDVEGEPAVVLRATVAATIAKQGQIASAYLTGSLLVVALAATGIMYYLVDRGVLARLTGLSRQVAGIADEGDPSSRVIVQGNDEIADLASDVNEMLLAIEESERVIQKARTDLELRVEERTEELRASEQRYRLVIQNMADCVFAVDLDGRVTLVNQCVSELTGFAEDELLGTAFLDLLTDATADEVERRMRTLQDPDCTWTVEGQLRHARGETVAVELRGAPILDDAGEITGAQWIARDVVERLRFEHELVHMASHDHLTGLHNRRFFEGSLEIALADYRRSGHNGAVVWLDLDDFKDVNDSFGHRAGDEVLVAVAEQLRKHVRESDVLARLGGDEFAVLLPQTTRRESEAAARRMLDAINTHTCSVQGHAVRVNASLGLVMYPQHGATAQDLLANADAAMYRAKETGRSHLYVHLFEPGLHDDMRKRIGWNERISSALRDDGFVVHAQPILDLRSDGITRYELLVRMQAEDGKLIAPSEFLPMAERLGLINEIDRWMISQAVALLRRHRLQLLNLDVNLSGKAFADQTIVGYISDALSSAHISPSRLGVEITETAAIADISKAQVFIGALKEMGCRISLDDFGSGFSSFYYLKHLPIDCLKVDGSFIRSLPESEQDRHLVRGVVDLCRGLKLEVAAEYVEDAERLRLVRELGFDYAQGFQVGRPGPAAKAIAMAPTEATG